MTRARPSAMRGPRSECDTNLATMIISTLGFSFIRGSSVPMFVTIPVTRCDLSRLLFLLFCVSHKPVRPFEIVKAIAVERLLSKLIGDRCLSKKNRKFGLLD
jgi:hypothetical protein